MYFFQYFAGFHLIITNLEFLCQCLQMTLAQYFFLTFSKSGKSSMSKELGSLLSFSVHWVSDCIILALLVLLMLGRDLYNYLGLVLFSWKKIFTIIFIL